MLYILFSNNRRTLKSSAHFFADFGLIFQENLKRHISQRFCFRYNVILLTLKFHDVERWRQVWWCKIIILLTTMALLYMEWYLGKNYTMPAYCYSLLADTVVIPTGIIMMHAYNSILIEDNDIMLDDSNNLHVVKAFMLVS